jgi:hypothetical protein
MAFTLALSTRGKLKGRDTKCHQLWKLEESDLSTRKDKDLRLKQLHFIQHDVVVASSPPTPVPPVFAPTPSPTPFVAPSPSPATIPEEFPLPDQSVPMMVAPLPMSVVRPTSTPKSPPLIR